MRTTGRIRDSERRSRLVARHHLGGTARDVVDAVRGVVALHSSDPLTPHLGAWARLSGFRTGHLDAALLDARTLVRLHAMRRTLFVVPTDEAPVFQAAVSREVAAKERRRVEAWVAAEIGAARSSGWLADLEERTVAVMGDRQWRTQELTAAVPGLGTQITVGSGKWTARTPLSSRLLYLLAMEGRIVRTSAAGSWRSSQYRWAAVHAWFPGLRTDIPPDAARTALAARYLAAHGPVTLEDLRWWTGWPVRQASAALHELGAVPVRLDGDVHGFVLPDDCEQTPPAADTVALLPGLDSTPMGWKLRTWYLGDHTEALFDRSGNVGPTVWVGGRVVGGWGQRPDGQVSYRLLEHVDAAYRVADAAAALTDWLGGEVVTPRFRTPLEKRLSQRAGA